MTGAAALPDDLQRPAARDSQGVHPPGMLEGRIRLKHHKTSLNVIDTCYIMLYIYRGVLKSVNFQKCEKLILRNGMGIQLGCC